MKLIAPLLAAFAAMVGAAQAAEPLHPLDANALRGLGVRPTPAVTVSQPIPSSSASASAAPLVPIDRSVLMGSSAPAAPLAQTATPLPESAPPPGSSSSIPNSDWPAGPPAVSNAERAAPAAEPYTVQAGETLGAALRRWAQRSPGHQVVWDSEWDYRLDASASFGHAFQEAISALTDSVASTNPTLKIRLYRNGVLVVTDTRK